MDQDIRGQGYVGQILGGRFESTEPGGVKARSSDVVSGQEVPYLGKIYPCRLDTRSTWERGAWPDELPSQ